MFLQKQKMRAWHIILTALNPNYALKNEYHKGQIIEISYQGDFCATPVELAGVPCVSFRNAKMSWAYRQIITPSFEYKRWVGVAFSDIASWNPSTSQKIQVWLGQLNPKRFPGVPCDKQKVAPPSARSNHPDRIFEFCGFGTFELEGIQLLIDEGLISLNRNKHHDFLLPTPKLVKLCKQFASYGFIH